MDLQIGQCDSPSNYLWEELPSFGANRFASKKRLTRYPCCSDSAEALVDSGPLYTRIHTSGLQRKSAMVQKAKGKKEDCRLSRT
jgi:hypothetical protein